jgi:subtilisin family serine protease
MALALLPGLSVAEPPRREAAVHPLVWEQLQAKGEAEILVMLRARADLSLADSLLTKEAKGRHVYEALRAVADQAQRNLRATLDAEGVDYQTFYIVNAIRLRAGDNLVRSLAARPDIGRILPNPWVQGIDSTQLTTGSTPLLPQGNAESPQSVERNIQRVHADDVWALGYTGQGIVVGGQDGGYQWDHPALKDQYRGWNGSSADHDYNWHDAIHENNPHTAPGNPCGFDSPVPCDDHGHGTHTMGIMVGDDGMGNQIGMAPGARWIGCRNMEEAWGTPATYLECFEFFLAPYPVGGTPAQGVPALAPHVVNNSWYCPSTEGCTPGILEEAVDSLRQSGIVVVVSAGNRGSFCGTVSNPPAIYQQSFSVANYDHWSNGIHSLSSRGPVTYGGDTYTKPDIAAPGTDIRSSIPANSYSLATGTSMAAPHVAGAVALLLSAAPGYVGSVTAIEQVLTSTAEPRYTAQGCGGDSVLDVPNNVWGWGIVDAEAAVRSTLHLIYLPFIVKLP